MFVYRLDILKRGREGKAQRGMFKLRLLIIMLAYMIMIGIRPMP